LGGIAAYNYGRIENSSFSGYIESNGTVGGIVGANVDFLGVGAIINGCRVFSAVINHRQNFTSSLTVGGIAGYCDKAIIEYCRVDATTIANIEFVGTTYIAPYMGIIVGRLSNSTLIYPTADLNSVFLNAGYLTGTHLANFGTTSPWAWGGNVSGTNTIVL
jgi:hypothetical protein